MKRVFILIYSFFALTAFSCEDTPVEPKVDPQPNPQTSTIPAEIQDGLWFWGSAGQFSYYDPDGNEVGREIEAGRQYRFYQENGQDKLEFHQYLGNRTSSNCVTEIYTYKRGKVKFEGNKFTFFPEAGSFRTVKSGTSASCAQEDKTRAATETDLRQGVSHFEIRLVQGEKLLYQFGEDDVNLEKSPLFVYQKVKQ